MIVMVEIFLYFVYPGVPPQTNVLTRLMLNMVVLVLLLVFMAGLRYAILRADPAYEWVATLAFGAGLVYLAITFAADSIQAGVVFSSTGPIDATTTGTLAPAHMLMYGAMGRLTSGLFLAAIGFAVLRTKVLPRWTGWTACGLAVAYVSFLPSLFFGTDAAQFYSAIGWGTTAFAGGLMNLWVLGVSIALLVRSRTHPAPDAVASTAAPHRSLV